MNSKFKITIPKPCHENWNKMTPKEKGRFCSSCAKTVVDFTKKSTKEIQDYLVENKNQKVCGHFYKKQLDTITIEIPQITFQQQLSFQKLFILALFFVMGTTLFSCQYSDGKKQKIENIILVDTIKKVEKEIDSLSVFNLKDSTSVWQSHCPKEEVIVGDLPIPPVVVDGLIDYTEVGEVEIEDTILGFIFIEEPPRFKQAKNLSKEKAIEDFNSRITKFVQNNFDIKKAQNLGLRIGKHKIYAQFTIDKNGNSINIRVIALHKALEKEAIRLIEKLPQFIPGKQAGKTVKTNYTLPITFNVD